MGQRFLSPYPTGLKPFDSVFSLSPHRSRQATPALKKIIPIRTQSDETIVIVILTDIEKSFRFAILLSFPAEYYQETPESRFIVK